jgi:hypothetical protein
MNDWRLLLDKTGQYFSDLLHVKCRTKKAIFSLVDENLVFEACPREPDQNK